MSAYRKLVSSEAIALLSILCIAAIFVGSYYQRRMDTSDDQALMVAQQVYHLLSKEPAPAPAPAPATTAQPGEQTSQVTSQAGPTAVTLLKLKALGLQDPAPIQVQVLNSDPQVWQVQVEHPKGLMRYLVTRQGVKQELR